MTIGQKLIKIREALSFTQLEFAEKLNITAKTLRDAEKNKHYPKLELIEKLVSEFNINPLFLFFDDAQIFLAEDSSKSSPDDILRNYFHLNENELQVTIKFLKLLKNTEFKDFINTFFNK